jgi:hypothetical protein
MVAVIVLLSNSTELDAMPSSPKPQPPMLPGGRGKQAPQECWEHRSMEAGNWTPMIHSCQLGLFALCILLHTF